MNAPPTPKAHNCKRRVLEPQQNDFLDCQSLQRSLKRMKVTSASPGELRLQRDLKHAVQHKGWQPLHHAWNIPATSNSSGVMRLSQSQEDPLQLVLEMSDGTAVWMTIPRLYPHRPPTIHTAHHKQMHLQAMPEDAEADRAAQNGVTVIQGWSPLLRLDETIQLVLPALRQRTPRFHQQRSEADCATEVPVFAMGEASLFETDCLFPPNRFDLGYAHVGSGGTSAVATTATMMQE